ncbi:MAG TPA: c-type cytochrome [Dongiaceae bacterium]|nr:c-type cytochrome [Dongiaceae bacterium]
MTIELTAKRILITLIGLIGAAVVVALLIAYSGLYNIAASREHPAWLDWFLTVGMQESVKKNSSDVDVVPWELNRVLPLGAAHFQTGCAVCHGAPDIRINPVFDHMLPSPPPLSKHAADWKPPQLFWIIKHGFQFTGMPGWSGDGRDDEVWAVALFVDALPEMSEQEYVTLANGNAGSSESSALINHCSRCHGTQQAASTSPLVPRLGGQKPQYLLRSLQEYNDNVRQSGIMEPLVNDLEKADLAQLAQYYARLDEPAQSPPEFDGALLEEGRTLAEVGDRQKLIPACAQCHGAASSPDFPALDGQHYAYLRNQLILWSQGGRQETAHGKLMAFVSRNLSLDQMEAVSAWYATRPVASGASR